MRWCSSSKAEGAGLSFWSVASALRDSVKQRTAELAASIQETDWKKELGAFQQGVKEETEELQHKTKEVVEHLPEKTKAVVEHLKTDHVSQGCGGGIEGTPLFPSLRDLGFFLCESWRMEQQSRFNVWVAISALKPGQT